MTETEYGPPIAVNGKRPEWLGDYEYVKGFERDGRVFSCKHQARMLTWGSQSKFCLPADHPYYQSAEYKASVVMPKNTPFRSNGEAVLPSVDAAVATLEAAGYTVTPPDPLAADREFLAGLMHAMGYDLAAASWQKGDNDARIPAAMDYLRQNKGRL